MNNSIRYFIRLLYIICCFSCSNNIERNKLELALEQAETNRIELEKVLQRYKEDSCKWKAAAYLIQNMPCHSYYVGNEWDKLYHIYESCSTKVINDDINAVVDSCQRENGLFDVSNLSLQRDIQTLDSAFLVHHIDESFRAWRGFPWGRNISFEDFCEYVLPYRIGDEQPTQWRRTIMEKWKPFTDSIISEGKCDDPFEVSYLVFKKMSESKPVYYGQMPCHPHIGSQLTDWNIGDCQDMTDILVYVFRALCLPCAIDFTPSSNYSTAHFWNSVKDGEGQTWWLDYASDGFGPCERNSYLIKGKVFRKSFHLCNGVRQLYHDVTNDYADSLLIPNLTVHASEINGQFVNGQRYALCIPQKKEWLPVEWAIAENGNLQLGGFKAGTAACVCIKKESQILPCSLPFRTEVKNGKPMITPFKEGEKERVTLLSKFPLFDEFYLGRMMGGVFEGASSESFASPDTLAVIFDSPSRLVNHIKLENNRKKYRYIRYKGPKDSHCNIAEIEFYTSLNDTVPLQGRIIGYPEPLSHNPMEDYRRVLDGDYYTSFDCALPSEGWVGLDLGKPQQIAEIIFVPRNKDDFIRNGDLYELFWWEQGHWASAGKKIATTDEIDFWVPKGSLLYLHNETRGNWERVFEFRNGHQVWW